MDIRCKKTILIYFLNLNLFLLPVISSAHSEKPSKTSLYSESAGVFRVEIETNLEKILIQIKQKYADENELFFPKNYENLRKLDPNKLKSIFFSVSKKFLNSTNLFFDGKSAHLSLRTVNVISNINLKEPRRSILILEAKYPVNAMNVEWSWYEKFGLNVVRTMDIDGKAFKSVWYRKSPKSPPLNLDGMPGKNFVNRFFNYLEIGFSHIIPKGFDHIIFVLGIFLLSTNWKTMLLQVTCFTIAHTMTLALSLFEMFNMPGRIVETLIALSIVYVGIENIFTERLRMWRPILIFLFGLLHGLGFAGALIELGIPMGYYLESLVAFNLGIEAGQILVIGVAYFIFFIFFYKISSYRKYVVIPGSITISTIGIWMFFDRLIS